MTSPSATGYATKLAMQSPSINFTTVLRWSGLAIWIAVSLTTLLRAQSVNRFLIWSLASAVFLAAFMVSQHMARHWRFTLALQSTAIVAMVAVLCNGYEGFLLVLVAAQLGWREQNRVGLLWIGAQTAVLGAAIAYEWTLRSAFLLTPPYLGFQLLMYAMARLLATERALRVQLEGTNRQLMELQQQLAQKSRVDERLRMTQELHDVFGHRLTALSLNLEAALHEIAGKSRDTVEAAQSLVRLLLQDIKEWVRTAKDETPVDLVRELRLLARDLPTPRIHLDCPSELCVHSPLVGRALLRCAQEFVTNSIRHGEARNVWIAVAAESSRIRLTAQDDGLGASHVRDGFGLSGMRRRMQELGGKLEVDGSAGRFVVCAELPLEDANDT